MFVSWAKLYLSFRVKFCQILALKINHGNIWEHGTWPLCQDHSKIGNSWYFIIARGKRIHVFYSFVCDWHFLWKDVHFHKTGNYPNKWPLFNYISCLLASFEFPAVPPIILFKNYLLNIPKVYSEDFICLGVSYRSIFIRKLQYQKITVSLQRHCFLKVTTVWQNFYFFHFLLWGLKFDVAAWEFWWWELKLDTKEENVVSKQNKGFTQSISNFF